MRCGPRFKSLMDVVFWMCQLCHGRFRVDIICDLNIVPVTSHARLTGGAHTVQFLSLLAAGQSVCQCTVSNGTRSFFKSVGVMNR